jgi:hypothetical protein
MIQSASPVNGIKANFVNMFDNGPFLLCRHALPKILRSIF